MNVVYVHGLLHSGSAFAFRRRWRKDHGQCEVFTYSAAFETLDGILARLGRRIREFPGRGDYVLVGHSFGGVLVRTVLVNGALEHRPPLGACLVATPLVAPTLATRLARTTAYRLATGECGRFLADERRMRELPAPRHTVVAIAGEVGPRAALLPAAPSDGRILVAETQAPWLAGHCVVKMHHTLLPFSAEVVARVREAW